MNVDYIFVIGLYTMKSISDPYVIARKYMYRCDFVNQWLNGCKCKENPCIRLTIWLLGYNTDVKYVLTYIGCKFELLYKGARLIECTVE